MELSYERYLADENLRDELERRAHRERAEALHRFLGRSARALFGDRDRAEHDCRPYALR